MGKLSDKFRLESNEDKSNMGDTLFRIVNGLGSLGFGFTIGAVAMSWVPLPQIWQEIMGALLIIAVFDYGLIIWEARTELQNGSVKQNKISKQAVTVSLWSSTLASVAFLVLQILPFVFSNPAQADLLASLSFNVRLILSLAAAGVMAYQFIKNSEWLRENPSRQRDRNKAEAYSQLSDEMVEIEGDILDKVPDVMRQKTQGYINKIVDGMAQSKAESIVRQMGYGELVDGQHTGPTMEDLQTLMNQLRGEFSASQDKQVTIADLQKMIDKLRAAEQKHQGPPADPPLNDQPVNIPFINLTEMFGGHGAGVGTGNGQNGSNDHG